MFRRRVLLGAATVIVAILLALNRTGVLSVGGDDLARYDGVTAVVSRVVDGDTIEVAMRDRTRRRPATRVRIWGIDAPEFGRDGRPDQPYAAEATVFADEALDGKLVRLVLEPHRVRGGYGRLLAHVEVEGELFGEMIVRAGLARADDRWRHRHIDRLRRAERDARENGVGIWSE